MGEDGRTREVVVDTVEHEVESEKDGVIWHMSVPANVSKQSNPMQPRCK